MRVLKPLSAAEFTICRIFSGEVKVVRTTQRARTSSFPGIFANDGLGSAGNAQTSTNQIANCHKQLRNLIKSVLIPKRYLNVSRLIESRCARYGAKVRVGDRGAWNTILNMVQRIEHVSTYDQLMSLPWH